MDQPINVKKPRKTQFYPGISHFYSSERKIGRTVAIVWSPDGSKLAWLTNRWSAGQDEQNHANDSIQIWDCTTAKITKIALSADLFDTTMAFDTTGRTVATAGGTRGIRIWDITSGVLVRTLETIESVTCIAWSPDGKLFASSSHDQGIEIWDVKTSTVIAAGVLRGIDDDREHEISLDLAWSPDSTYLASAGYRVTILVVKNGELNMVAQYPGRGLYQVAWSPNTQSHWIAGASSDRTVKIWNIANSKEDRVLEGHSAQVRTVAFSNDGQVLATADARGNVIFWRCSDWSQIGSPRMLPRTSRLAFHPQQPWLAIVTGETQAGSKAGGTVQLWNIDMSVLCSQAVVSTVTYTTAKIVLVGESGAGKTGLGWRLAHEEFKEHSSTHGQQFWIVEKLGETRDDGTLCEAILWDLAGQPDYRLIHALFLDDVDLALVVFDPTRNENPLDGVEFWLSQLNGGSAKRPDGKNSCPPIILVAARADRGTGRFTLEEIQKYCNKRGLSGYVCTSAQSGEGIEDLVQRMRRAIRWDEKTATVTTDTFKKIKDFVLKLKGNSRRKKVIFSPDELRRELRIGIGAMDFTRKELLTASAHLANHGYVALLKSSKGEPRVLLVPELLNNLAASIVLEARRNSRGLGSVEEQTLLSNGYSFPELEKLAENERDTLLDSTVTMLLQHNVCYRETDPLASRAYFVFPELINLKKPQSDEETPIEDDVAYTVTGAVENAYASLVVLLGYTNTFTRTNQWRDHARYEVGEKLICGFRLEEEREGALDFLLYFGTDVDAPVRAIFKGLFESFIARRNLAVQRYEPVRCDTGHQIDRRVVKSQLASGSDHAYCPKCGKKIILTKSDTAIKLTRQQRNTVEEEKRVANQRSQFEQAAFRLKTYVAEQKITPPQCFISYAWGDTVQERWVERLAEDLLKAGIVVVLDRWENERIGSSVPRFVEKIAKCDRVIVVGTLAYRSKYENGDSMRGYVAAAEGDLIGKRMIGTEKMKKTVLPILLDGSEELSFPDLLHGRVYGDFRDNTAYVDAALSLLLSLYEIESKAKVIEDVRELLRVKDDAFS